MLFPLMDMFFILLLFFIVNVGVTPQKGEKVYWSAVPNEGQGEAQILLQMIDAERVLWLDNTSFHSGGQSGFPWSHVIAVSSPVFREKLKRFHETYGQCIRKDVLTVIRCPDSLNYGEVEAMQDSLSAAFEQEMSGFTLKLSLLEAGPLDSIKADRKGDNEVDIVW